MQEFYFALLGGEVKLPVYLTGVGSTDPEWHCIRPSGHVYHQVIYTASGEGTLTVDGEVYRIAKGSGFFLPAFYPHEYHAKEGSNWETHWVTFSGSCISEIMEKLDFSKPVVFRVGEISTLEKLWEKMLKTIHSQSIYSGYANSAYLYSFLVELNKLISCPASPRENHRTEQLKTIIDYIDKNYSDEISLTQLAKIVGLSPQYICRIFKECMNMRPFEYLTKKRIFEAKKLLLDTDCSINEISKRVGYNDCSYFCAVFKKQENVSPAEYRLIYAERSAKRMEKESKRLTSEMRKLNRERKVKEPENEVISTEEAQE